MNYMHVFHYLGLKGHLGFGESQVRLDFLHITKFLPGILGRYRWRNNNIIPSLPIDGCNNTLLVAHLERVNDPQDLSRVSSG